MPELPDLTIVAEELQRRVAGRTVLEATAPTPILVRATPDELEALHGATLGSTTRRGKFLLVPFERGGTTERVLAANAMLAGRFWLTPTADKVRARTGLRLRLDDGTDLRYVDREMLGKLYLVAPDSMDDIPGWAEMGPDADDPELTLDAFRQRIRRHPGELKPLLRNPRFVAGIGNAYSDEILWEAQLAPFRKRSTLTDADIERLYIAMRSVLADAIDRAPRPRPARHPDPASRVPQGPSARRRAVSHDAGESCARSAAARRRRSAEPASRRSRALRG